MSWQLIFALSRVNGGLYIGDYLNSCHWQWPKETWLQRRLAELKEQANEAKQMPAQD